MLIKQLLAARDRWFLWLPAILAAGIGLLFCSQRLWPWGYFIALAAGLSALAILWRHKIGWCSLFCAGLLCVGGAALLQTRIEQQDTQLLQHEWRYGHLTGSIESIQPREVGLSVVLQVEAMQPMPILTKALTPIGAGPAQEMAGLPKRVQISVRSPPANLQIGQRIKVRANLMPPSKPAMPGAYDFRRHAFFKGISAYGYVLGKVEILPSRLANTTTSKATIKEWLHMAWLRDKITKQVNETLENDTASVAAALLTGQQSAISDTAMQAMRAAGITHILSISGLHIAIVAGLFFAFFRWLLVLWPPIALRWPIKKIAAFIALIITGFYTLMVGAPVPTVRALLMTALVFMAIMLDRRSLTQRSVALAALCILIFWPDVLLSPSFQLSFAAVIGMVAFYESMRERRLNFAPLAPYGLAHKGLLYLGGILTTTLIAGAATAPFIAFHFQQLPVYSVLANMLALPLTSLVIMPMALLAYPAMGLGMAAPILSALGWGVEALLKIADTISAWPAASLYLPPLPDWGLLLMALGGLWLCLWRQSWRWLGLIPIALGCIGFWLVTPPDLIISPDGKSLILRLPDGSYAWRGGRNKFIAEQWQARLGQARLGHVILAKDKQKQDVGLGFVPWQEAQEKFPENLVCDKLGCIWHISGSKIALPVKEAALKEDCLRADAVIAYFYLNPACASWRVGRQEISRQGALSLWVKEGMRHEFSAGSGHMPWQP